MLLQFHLKTEYTYFVVKKGKETKYMLSVLYIEMGSLQDSAYPDAKTTQEEKIKRII